MLSKLRKYWNRFSEILEHFMAALVILAIIAAIIALWEHFQSFWLHRTESGAFTDFLERVLDIIIGIELFKMLCKPRAATVLEVMMFCIARHMIVHDTSALENLLTVVGVAVIVITNKYFLSPQKTEKKEENESNHAEVEKET